MKIKKSKPQLFWLKRPTTKSMAFIECAEKDGEVKVCATHFSSGNVIDLNSVKECLEQYRQML